MAKSTATTQADNAPAADPPQLVRVRIIQNRTHAAGGYFAIGATPQLPMADAKALEALGKAVIIGV